MKRYIHGFLIVIVLITGCASLEDDNPGHFEDAPLMGMIYDSESFPVSGALVVIDDDKSAQTDINGRVLFGAIPFGIHSVVIAKEGFEEVGTVLNFSNRDQVLYSTLVSLTNILNSLEAALKQGQLSDAASYLHRASKIDSGDIRYKYLNVVYLTKRGECKKVLDEIEILRKSYPDDPYIVMTCAEILFRGVDKKEEALELLNNLPVDRRDENFKSLIEEILSETDPEDGTDKTTGADNG